MRGVMSYITSTMGQKAFAAAAERNRGPIAEVLSRLFAAKLPASITAVGGLEKAPLDVLEVSSGTGQHVSHFAKEMPHTRWQPTDYSDAQFDSIRAYINEASLPNVRDPVKVDASAPDDWPFADASFDAIVNINMVHIAPFQACEGLLKGAGRVLRSGGLLVMYGPYMIDGVISPQSNVEFDAWLKAQNPSYGLRDLTSLKALALQSGLSFVDAIAMPANNFTVVYSKK